MQQELYQLLTRNIKSCLDDLNKVNDDEIVQSTGAPSANGASTSCTPIHILDCEYSYGGKQSTTLLTESQKNLVKLTQPQKRNYSIKAIQEVASALKTPSPFLATQVMAYDKNWMITARASCDLLSFLGLTIKEAKLVIDDSSKTLTIAEVKNLTIQLLSGLKDLHDNDIVHRDLKPSNVIMFEIKGEETNNTKYLYKIIDFDSAAKTQNGKKAKSLGNQLYTPGLEAHELKNAFMGQHHAGHQMYGLPATNIDMSALDLRKSDRYTLGLVLRDYVRPRIADLKNLEKEQDKELTNFDNLIKQLTKFEPEKRISLTAAQQHPFFGKTPQEAQAAFTNKRNEFRQYAEIYINQYNLDGSTTRGAVPVKILGRGDMYYLLPAEVRLIIDQLRELRSLTAELPKTLVIKNDNNNTYCKQISSAIENKIIGFQKAIRLVKEKYSEKKDTSALALLPATSPRNAKICAALNKIDKTIEDYITEQKKMVLELAKEIIKIAEISAEWKNMANAADTTLTTLINSAKPMAQSSSSSTTNEPEKLSLPTILHSIDETKVSTLLTAYKKLTLLKKQELENNIFHLLKKILNRETSWKNQTPLHDHIPTGISLMKGFLTKPSIDNPNGLASITGIAKKEAAIANNKGTLTKEFYKILSSMNENDLPSLQTALESLRVFNEAREKEQKAINNIVGVMYKILNNDTKTWAATTTGDIPLCMLQLFGKFTVKPAMDGSYDDERNTALLAYAQSIKQAEMGKSINGQKFLGLFANSKIDDAASLNNLEQSLLKNF